MIDLDKSSQVESLVPGHDNAEEHRSLMRRLKLHASSKLVAEVAGRALQFLLVYQAQVALGPATYGQFTYALAAGFVLAQLADLGMQLIITREVARDETHAASTVGAGLALKLVVALVVGGLLALISLTRPPEVQAATFALGLAMVLNSFVEFLGYTFRGLQRVEYEAVLVLLARMLIAALGSWAVRNGLGLTGLAAAYVLGGGVTAALGYNWLSRRFFRPSLVFDRARWWSLLRQALPLGGAIVLSIAYTRMAIFLLDALRGPEATGVYGVAQKLTEPMTVIPAAVMAAVFPAFIQASTRENGGSGKGKANGQAGWLRARSIGLLTIVGTTLAGVGVFGGPWLIERLYQGQYADSAAALQILALALLPTFVNYALTHFLIALGKQHLNLLFNAIIFVLNFALCVTLIPRFGPTGAAVAVMVSEWALFALCWHALSRETSEVSRIASEVYTEPDD